MCVNCAGWGWVAKQYRHSYWKWIALRATCPRCNGKGVVMAEARSWECGLRKIEQGEKTWRMKQGAYSVDAKATDRGLHCHYIADQIESLEELAEDLRAEAFYVMAHHVRLACGELRLATRNDRE